MRILKIEDERYPEMLRNIKEPPKRLFVDGNVEMLNKPIISIIGSRVATNDGMKNANEFANKLSKNGITIASGMAKGIDTSAHLGAMLEKGRTIAVLANGFNHIYPKENVFLYEEILKNNGCVISEYAPEEKAESYKFIKRNRIVSGLSRGVLVVEAAYRSGTSITAKFALNQNKKVYCLPHNLDESHGVGTNRLIKNGAILITSPEEIITDLVKQGVIRKNNVVKSKNKKYSKENSNTFTLDNVEDDMKNIFKLLVKDKLSSDEISTKLKREIYWVNMMLSKMELQGIIIQDKGKYTINI